MSLEEKRLCLHTLYGIIITAEVCQLRQQILLD